MVKEKYKESLEAYYRGVKEAINIIYKTEEDREKAFQNYLESEDHNDFIKILEEEE